MNPQFFSWIIFIVLIDGIFLLIIGTLAYFAVKDFRARELLKVAEHDTELEEAKRKMNEAEKIGHFGSFVWDFKDPSLSFWSEEMYQLFGLVKRGKCPTPEAIVEVTHEGERGRVNMEWTDAQKKPGPFSLVTKVVLPSKQVRYIRMQGVSTFGIDKKLQKIQGLAHDISSEMEVNTAKTEFVSLASHQLKTPIISMHWLIEALKDGSLGSLNPEQQTYIANLAETNRRMGEMVADLLSVSHIELNMIVIKAEDLNVRESVQSVIDEQKHVIEEKHQTFVFTCAPDLPPLHADKSLARMIFQNLISNAVKYTPAEGRVECEITLTGAKQEVLFLRVTDTGIGIPKDEQVHVFEKLHRASNAKTLIQDGTGLGLYVIKMIIDRVGGNITFESTEGKGTTFYASIPLMWQDTEQKS